MTVLSFGIPTLDDFAPLDADRPAVVVIALPWQPAGETSFVVAQSFAKQAHNPLCVHRGWSPHWDGPLDVHDLEGSPRRPTIDYDALTAAARPGQPVIVDQFHLFHWDTAKGHPGRFPAVTDASWRLRLLAEKTGAPVVVFLERRTRDETGMDGADLRSDGALATHADTLLMVDPHPRRPSAGLLVVKHPAGLAGGFPGVDWPQLPRTAARRA